MVEILNDRVTLLRTANVARDINNYLEGYRSLDRILYVSDSSYCNSHGSLTVYSLRGIVSSYVVKDTVKRCNIETLVLTSFDLTTIAILEEVANCNVVLALGEADCSKFLNYFDNSSRRGVARFEEVPEYNFNGNLLVSI